MTLCAWDDKEPVMTKSNLELTLGTLGGLPCAVLLVGPSWNTRWLETREAMLTKSMGEGISGVPTFVSVLSQLVGDRNQRHRYRCKPVA